MTLAVLNNFRNGTKQSFLKDENKGQRNVEKRMGPPRLEAMAFISIYRRS